MYDYCMKKLVYQKFILGTQDSFGSRNLFNAALADGLGGVIFFTRDITSKEQFMEFVNEIKKKANRPLFLSIDQETLYPREIFLRLCLCNAKHFIAIHNHPSGNASPSKDDISLTKRLEECGKLMGIALIDHIIIGDDHFSFAHNNMLGD